MEASEHAWILNTAGTYSPLSFLALNGGIKALEPPFSPYSRSWERPLILFLPRGSSRSKITTTSIAGDISTWGIDMLALGMGWSSGM